VAIEVGERLGELLGSNWSDLELETGVWNLERQLTKHGELTSPKTMHGIRGTAARLAPRAHTRGVTLQDLSMVMGHSSTAVAAKVYVQLLQTSNSCGREQAEERFPPGDGSSAIAQPLSGSQERPRGALLVALTTPRTAWKQEM
jgi:hypothetical protein